MLAKYASDIYWCASENARGSAILDGKLDYDDKGSYEKDLDMEVTQVRFLLKYSLCLMAVDIVSITAPLSLGPVMCRL